jgi:hypothetical protein
MSPMMRRVPAVALTAMGTVALVASMVVLGVCAGAVSAAPSPRPLEIVPGSFHFTPSSVQAGVHSNWTTVFDIAHNARGETFNDLRTTVVNVPVGFTASNTAVPRCSDTQLLDIGGGNKELSLCPPESAVGTISFDLRGERHTQPLYFMETTSYGVTGELGFKVSFVAADHLVVNVRPNDEGLTVTAPQIESGVEIRDVKVTVWGVPASHEHDIERQQVCVNEQCHNELGGPIAVHTDVKPFLSNPTSCGTFTASMRADSWEAPQSPEWLYAPVQETGLAAASTQTPVIAECERVPFDPSIEAQPSTRAAESPTGLEVSLVVPQAWDNPFTVATANLKDAVVTLPEGMTANPGLAEGLGACTPEEYAAESAFSHPGQGCPPESKIGSIVIETPLLEEPIPGVIYIATPYDNVPSFGDAQHPKGSLLALYVVAKDPQRGILVKVAGKITPNETTGQLVTTFLNNPQQPFSKFTLKFRPGAAAPLISPPACGGYALQAALTPWSAPEEPHRLTTQPFQITQGVHEGPCPSGGIPTFNPQVISGTQNNAGGSYSQFYLRILREDGEQELIKFSTILPPGLTGNLTGIAKCADSAIEEARTKTGEEEIEHPSCPPGSEVGHTIVGAGVGSVLAQNPGKVYLAGPYHGAPLSIVSVTSAKVGPFDLGTVVIRFALDINPITAQVEISGAQSDPIPHIIKGIVVHVRDIRTYIDRSKFMINPTNCQPLGITDQIVGSGSNYANPANQDTVNVNTPFEGADCASLAFKPVFKVSTSGKTSRMKGASLSVKLTAAGALGTQSNIRSVKVDLPKQLPSRLTTLQKACPDSTFNANPAACPAASIVGHAKAITPILPVPLEGPAYFVSHGGAKFPELIVVLQGYGFTIDLHGETFINKAGITSSTFHTIPDAPVGSFELTLPEGPYSALAANGNLCKGTLKMPTAFVAQNGAEIHESTKISVRGCAKTVSHKAARHASPHGKGAHRRRH